MFKSSFEYSSFKLGCNLFCEKLDLELIADADMNFFVFKKVRESFF